MGTHEDGFQLNEGKTLDVPNESGVKQSEVTKQPVTAKREESKSNQKPDSVKTERSSAKQGGLSVKERNSSVNRNVPRGSGIKLGAPVVAQSKLNSLVNVPKQKHAPLRHVPAHAKAPFKTAPETKWVSRSGLHSSRSTARSAAISARSSSGRSAARSAGNRNPRSASSGSIPHHQASVVESRQVAQLSNPVLSLW